MPHTSPFFSTTTGYSGEVNLVDDLVREQIKIYGLDMLYMPRYMLNLDTLLHESTKSAFELAMPMPLYIKSFDGYDNSMEMLTYPSGWKRQRNKLKLKLYLKILSSKLFLQSPKL